MANNDNATVKTALTTFRILEKLNELGEANVTELAAGVFALEEQHSQLSQYARTRGIRDQDGNTYRVGLRLLAELGGRARHRTHIYQVSKEELDEAGRRNRRDGQPPRRRERHGDLSPPVDR